MVLDIIMPQSAKDIDESSEEMEEELKSKSEVKREMHKLQDFAQSLIEMSKHQRSRLPLSEDLKDIKEVDDVALYQANSKVVSMSLQNLIDF